MDLMIIRTYSEVLMVRFYCIMDLMGGHYDEVLLYYGLDGRSLW